ncbi:O-antigen ligase family protein [Shewanella algae]|uniref:O-antigen ligase family protein n=1 Tax=Shewanella algae TaxID=38313 RepID=UPI001C59855E|nr:O-antigen ligase family protein [Shewanella algae]
MTTIRNSNYYIFIFIFCSAVLADFISVYSGYRISIIPRVMLIFTCLYGCLNSGLSKAALRISLILIIIVTLQNLLLLFFFSNNNAFYIVDNISLILKLFSFPLVFYWYKKLSRDNFASVAKLANFLLLIYISTILISPLLGWESLLTYGDTGRFGYKGVIAAGNETAILLLVACFWAAKNYLNKNSTFNLLVLFSSLMSSLIIGTKAGVLIFVTVLFTVFVVNFKTVSAKHKYSTFGLIVLALFYVDLDIFSDFYETLEVSFAYFESKLVGSSIHNYISLFLSGRDIKLYTVINSFDALQNYSLVIGAYPISKYMIEMDYFDSVLLFGAPLGTIIFIYYISFVWRYSNSTLLDFMFIFLFIALTILAGHVLFSMVHSPILAAYLINNKSYNYLSKSYEKNN